MSRATSSATSAALPSTSARPHAAASSARRSSPPGAETKIAAGPRTSARCALVRVARTCTRGRSRRGIAGRKPSGFVCSKVASHAGASSRRRSSARVVERPAASSSSTRSWRFRRRPEEAEVDPERDDAVVTLEPLGGCHRGLFRCREEGVDPSSQAVASRAARGVAEAIDGEEGGCGQGVRRGEREVRKARQAWLEAVHDVETAVGESESEVCPHRHRDAHVRSARQRDRGADRDDVRVGAALERSSTCEQVACARRGREHRHLVTELPERFGRPFHVRVHLVWLRPRERRDEADAEAHASQVTTCNLAPWARSRSRRGRTGRTGSTGPCA